MDDSCDADERPEQVVKRLNSIQYKLERFTISILYAIQYTLLTWNEKELNVTGDKWFRSTSFPLFDAS